MDTLVQPCARQRPEQAAVVVHDRPKTDGKFLLVDGERFWIRGVTYGTFIGNSRGELLPEPHAVREDMARMAACGINTIRTYTTPPCWFLDLAWQQGLKVVAGIFWEGRQCVFEDAEAVRRIEERVTAEMRTIAGHPALLMVCLGNEIPPLVARWHGKEKVEQLLRRLRDRIKQVDLAALVTYANYPPTEFMDLSFLDVLGFNVYLEREPEFRAYLARLQMIAGDRPLFISELGLDSLRNGPERQAEVLEWQLRAVWEKGLCGATVYAWTDEWAVAGKPIQDWDFGLVDRERRPKAALDAVRNSYQRSRYEQRAAPWPQVSVVCCAWNAEATLTETLESLSRLNYPEYEVILIDDGSRDGTARIGERYACRMIQVPNGGLSRARNLGIEAANGEIVAFIDSDAAADPDWLYFLVTQLEAQGAGACGGPNLSFPDDPEGAHQVARAPGNPTHILLDDETAEHIPGCNMAFRRSVLLEIRGFDPVYRVAGDDVDVCWKVLERGEKIAFSPAALVWHHRRPDQAAYLRQQWGYGVAEALLEARYPERYGLMGGAAWKGRVYEGPQPGVPLRLPLVRDRVYHGPQANGLFQSVYTPHAPWWVSLVTTPEFYGLNLALSASAVAAALAGLDAWPIAAVPAAAGVIASGWCCMEAGVRMCAHDELPRRKRWRRALGVAKLHFLQPWARWIGRVQGARRCRWGAAWPPRAVGSLWAGWDRRDEWLAELARLLRDAGMEVREEDGWGEHDLHVGAHPGYRAVLQSVVEHQTQVRFRARVHTPFYLRLLEAAILILMAGTVACPPLLPLMVPLGLCFHSLTREKRRLQATIASLGRKAGLILGMVPLEQASEPVRQAGERAAAEPAPSEEMG